MERVLTIMTGWCVGSETCARVDLRVAAPRRAHSVEEYVPVERVAKRPKPVEALNEP